MNNAIPEFAKEQYPLAPHTLYRIGGPARVALFPRDLKEVEEGFRWLREQGLPMLVLGGGSNLLIDDQGYPGGVLFTGALDCIECKGDGAYRVGAGAILGDLVRRIMAPNNYRGVGALTGIPGTVGGALFMNAGTVNGSVCELASSVRLLDQGGTTSLSLSPDDYDYRTQRFCGPESVIVEADFRFEVSEQDEQAVYQHYMRRRRETQPQGWCCGSVFKNPPGEHAGRLIEAAGLKGTRRGGAVISEKHANFIMNENSASFQDVLFLIELAKATVRDRFGIDLREEVRIIDAARMST